MRTIIDLDKRARLVVLILSQNNDKCCTRVRQSYAKIQAMSHSRPTVFWHSSGTQIHIDMSMIKRTSQYKIYAVLINISFNNIKPIFFHI